MNKIKNIINNLSLQDKKIVAWGTAGAGSSLLNACEFDYKTIPYVIDSDQRKQGLYVPGTGQLVVDAEFFSQSPPDVILILSQFHKKDIMDQISQIYGDNVKVLLPDKI